MAEEDNETEEVEVLAVSKEKQKEAKGVDSVSDYVDEKETSTDVAAVSMALGNFESSMQKKVQTVNLREEDIKMITDECEISKDAAEALLRNYNGNIEEALRAYISGQ
eukprot:gene24183-32609_t